MGSFETVTGILGFIIISQLVLIQGGGAEFLFDMPSDVEAPQLVPGSERDELTELDLAEDYYQKENITFKRYEELDNKSYGLESHEWLTNDTLVAVLEDGKPSGRISFNTPGVRSIHVFTSTYCGGILQSSRMQITDREQNDPDYVCGEVDANLEDQYNPNFIVFNFLTESEGGGIPQLYFLEWSTLDRTTEATTGFFGLSGFLQDIGQIVQYPLRLWDYIQYFPWYIKVFYGGLITWLVVDILQLG